MWNSLILVLQTLIVILFSNNQHALGFIAPEQCNGYVPDCRNDIYSLGSILQKLEISCIYRWVISRCHAPISKRFQNVALMRIAFHTVRYRLHLAYFLSLFNFAIGGLSVIIWPTPDVRNCSRLQSGLSQISVMGWRPGYSEEFSRCWYLCGNSSLCNLWWNFLYCIGTYF